MYIQNQREHQQYLEQFIALALKEDVGDGDHTSNACIPEDGRSTAKLLIKSEGIVAGVEAAQSIFKHMDPDAKVTIHIKDGKDVSYGDVVFDVECNSRVLLMAERLVLNLMQRMSAIATLSNRFAFEVIGTGAKILDTRKTTPLLRYFEKWAVNIGGCHNYRFGLYDRIMIKDNHIKACGGITQAIHRVHEHMKQHRLKLPVTIEVSNLNELHEVLAVKQVDRIMLDNFELPILKEAVDIVDKAFETEASGGITIRNVYAYAKTGVDYISVGALTHSAGSMDMSLKIV